MSITLEGIDITGLVFIEDFHTGISGNVQISNDGSVIVYEQEVSGAIRSLEGGDDWGWLDSGTLSSLKDLASVIGAIYTLDYEGTLYTVRFMSESIPVIFGEKLVNRSNIEDTDYYKNIVIKLMEV